MKQWKNWQVEIEDKRFFDCIIQIKEKQEKYFLIAKFKLRKIRKKTSNLDRHQLMQLDFVCD